MCSNEVRNKIIVEDHVVLLTGGVLCNKGNKGLVTKDTNSTVHFTVQFTKHNTHNKYRNIHKV